ncbi:hypothetical protein ACG04Q_03880 [Roseateles sp. DXS20W]|uniref:DUF2029 domain-containing protein n=1 Tax=Pelomonas lactea TaxID=3299030 RepID=A0ABW7GFG7_9BURK
MSVHHRLPTLAALIAIAAWMLLAHPYQGIWHDGILYFGQVLLNSRVPGLAQDIFFAGGSQDRYSAYSPLMVPLYAHLGQMGTHVAVLLVGWALMLTAVLALLRRFEPTGPLPLWGLLALAVMSPTYGGTRVFSYGEAFVTARNFAEPALLWSLVALLAGRWRAMVGLQLLAALFHPLMALPVMAVSWCHLAGSDRRWWWLLAGIPVALLAGFAGVPPWAGLLKVYDPYWWALVETGNRQVLLANWTLQDHLTVVLDLAVLLAVTRLRPSDAGTRLIYAVVLITVAFFGLTALCVDGLHIVLLTQLQLWRAHWVAHLLSMALVPWVLARLWQRGGLWPVSACALALALLNAHIGTDHGVATLSLWALASLVAWRVRNASRITVRLACGGIALCALGLSAQQLDGKLRQLSWLSPLTLWDEGLFELAAFPAVAAAGLSMLMLIARRGTAGAGIATGLSAALLCATVLHWDQRQDLARAVESPPAAGHPFMTHIPADATVYWPDQLLPVWGLLERSSHYAAPQGAGVLFNRDTGLMFGPRKASYRRINEDRERCRTGATLGRSQANWLRCDMPGNDRLMTLCADFDAPDFLVLRGLLNGKTPLASWQPAAHREPPQTFHLYACTQFRPAESP